MSKLTVYPLSCSYLLIDHYQNLSQLPGFALLQSSDTVSGHYDIVTALAYDEFKVTRHTGAIDTVFDAFRERLIQTEPTTHEFPFQGGAIGYISYDLGAELLGVKTCRSEEIGDIPLIDMNFYDWAIIADHKKKVVNLVVANLREETKDLVQDIIRIWYKKPNPCIPFQIESFFEPLKNFNEYEKNFKAIHHDLMWGRAYQVNYTIPFLSEYSGDPWGMYQKISARNKVPFSAFLRGMGLDVLSFSPERFLKYEQGQLLTSPIKGSAARSKDPEQDKLLLETLKASEKNRAENVMIVDLLRNDLGKVAKPGSVQVTSLCQPESYLQVHHLVSHIKAQCRSDVSWVDALKACFPGGSITGAPKLESMRIIHEVEQIGRGVYCGCIGYFSTHGQFDTNIAIRTAVAKNGRIFLPAGGGIVIDSSAKEEYQECYTKIKAITELLK